MDAVKGFSSERESPSKLVSLDQLKYEFSHKSNGTYFWVLVKGALPGVTRTKIVTANAEWFWGTSKKEKENA